MCAELIHKLYNENLVLGNLLLNQSYEQIVALKALKFYQERFG